MKTKDVLKILGVSRVTLCKYVKDGKIRVKELPNGYYNYNEDDVFNLAGLEHKRMNVIYARVSTNKQKKDLENQIEAITSYMNRNGIGVDKVYSDVASGMTLDRKGFLELLNDVMNNKIDKVYISYKDRLARLSYELVTKLFLDNATQIEIINKSDDKSLEEELFEDIIQVVHSFSMKMYSRRRLAKKLTEETIND